MDRFFGSLTNFNNQTTGKDRIFRLAQYGSRLIWWFSEKCHYDKDAINKLKNLEYSLSTTRKLLRLGKSLDVLISALKSIHLNDLTLRLSLTLGKISQSLYLLTDHIIWFGRVGLFKVDKEKWGIRSYKFWLLSILLFLIRDFYELWSLLSLEMKIRSQCGTLKSYNFPLGIGAAVSSGSGMSTFHQSCYVRENVFAAIGPFSRWALSHKDVVLDTVKNSCDLVIPLTALSFTDMSPGVVGLCGVISSIIGVITIVDPLSRLQPS